MNVPPDDKFQYPWTRVPPDDPSGSAPNAHLKNPNYDGEQIRRKRLDDYISQYCEDKDPKKVRSSEFYRALDAISRAALAYALERNASVGDRLGGGFTQPHPRTVEELLNNGFVVVGGLRDCIDWPKKDKPAWYDRPRFWSHQHWLIAAVKRGKAPRFDRSGIESTVTEYLRLPYRAPEIDRLLVDLLMAIEIAAFTDWKIDRNMNWVVFLSTGRRVSNPLVNCVSAFLFWFGLAFGLQWLGLINRQWEGISYQVAFWLGVASLVSGVLLTVKPDKLTQQMSICYSAMDSAGPISAPHIRELLAASTQKGVVWPAPLHALLDDIMARGGKL
jgi:hypothetical protein